MNDPENYLNPPQAATREPQSGGCDMNAFRAELLRNPNWLVEHELAEAKRRRLYHHRKYP